MLRGFADWLRNTRSQLSKDSSNEQIMNFNTLEKHNFYTVENCTINYSRANDRIYDSMNDNDKDDNIVNDDDIDNNDDCNYDADVNEHRVRFWIPR